MDKETEKRFNDMETRLVQRFNSLIKKAEAREALENKRIEKLIDQKIELALQKISNKIDKFLAAANKRL